MQLTLKKSQLKILSEFCSDIAKGVMLAGILGQISFITESFLIKTLILLVSFSISLSMLYFALYFSKDI